MSCCISEFRPSPFGGGNPPTNCNPCGPSTYNVGLLWSGPQDVSYVVTGPTGYVLVSQGPGVAPEFLPFAGAISSILGTTNQITATALSVTQVQLSLPNLVAAPGRVTATTTGTLAGFNPGSLAGDPASPVNGDIWYNSNLNQLRGYANGGFINLAGGGIVGSGLVSGQVVVATGSAAVTSYAGFTSDASGNLAAASLTAAGNVRVNGTIGIGTGAIANYALYSSETLAGAANASAVFSDTLQANTNAHQYGVVVQNTTANGTHAIVPYSGLYIATPTVTGDALSGGYMLDISAPAGGMSGALNLVSGNVNLGSGNLSLGSTTALSYVAFYLNTAISNFSSSQAYGNTNDPTFNFSANNQVGYGVWISPILNTGSGLTGGVGIGLVVQPMTKTGSGSLANATGVIIGAQSGAANNVDLQIGTTTNLTLGNFAILQMDFLPNAFTGSLGYITGQGVGAAIVQSTSKSTTVVMNKLCGDITMNNAALANATAVIFTLTNSFITATSSVHVSVVGGTSSAYLTNVVAQSAGSCNIAVYNASGGPLSEAIVLHFHIHTSANT